METYYFNVDPVAKPRMTQRDKWKGRSIVNRYNAYKDLMTLGSNQMHTGDIPTTIESLIFYIKMPESWSKKKKEAMNGRGHQQTPDLDNLLKAFQDALCKKDQHIYSIKCLGKYWAEEGAILLTLNT